ncbi:MAG: polymer-forming cytoskeletal protein [Acidobacteria bacterium]|nr:polymer-forming cytoskeletal protein [Acidobacteriota bacterium]
MKSGAAQVTAPTDLRTRLGEGTEINGEVKFTEVMKVESKVSGKVISESGSLIVSEQGQVQADIEAGFVEVYGTVEGKITAKYKVEIRPGGRVYGDIYTPVLNIEHGAIFDGKCHMIDENQKTGKLTPVSI